MKIIKKTKIIILLFLIAINFSSCNKDEGKKEFDGSIESVKDFFGDDIVDALEDLGFIINSGDNPPTIAGTFIASPFILQASTVTTDFVGMSFPDYIITFTNQSKNDFTIDFSSTNGSQQSEGFGSYVSGDGSRFSVYLKADTSLSGETAKIAIAISGRMTDTGIEDFQYANLMLDNKGNPSGVFIENNTGRLVYDQDGFSPKQ